MKKKLIVGILIVLTIGTVAGIGLNEKLKQHNNQEKKNNKQEDTQAESNAEASNGSSEKNKKEDASKEFDKDTNKDTNKGHTNREEADMIESLNPEIVENMSGKDEDTASAYTYDVENDYFQITLPESWREDAVIEKVENSIIVSQKKSYESNGGGMLFGIEVTNNKNDLESLPDYTILKEKDGSIFYCIRPTDVQFVIKYKEQYMQMEKEISKVLKTFINIKGLSKEEAQDVETLDPKEDTKDSSKQENDFVLPNSDKKYITQEELDILTKEQLRLARNEIYARKGYIFHSKDLKDYFESKSWYKGTVEKEDFDGSVFNEFEKKNLKIIEDKE